jgi:rhamnulokinase
MGVAVSEPNLSDAAFEGGFTNEGSADGGVLLMKNLTGLWIVQECVRTWQAAGRHYEWAELENAAASAAPFRSFIDPQAGELQAPADMCAAVRDYCARSGQPVPESVGAMARCTFESLGFAYRAVVEDLERITDRALTTIRIVGGGCLNRFLCQMTADACGRRVIAGPVEAAALGNAMVQAVATGHLSSIAEGKAALRQSLDYEEYLPASGGWDEAFARYGAAVALGRNRERAANSQIA